MAWFSNHVIEAMGFCHYPEGVTVRARFHFISIAQIMGLAWTNRKSKFRRFKIANSHIYLGIGLSPNKICQRILNDNFVDDETKWMQDNNCSGPFVMIFANDPKLITKITNFLFEKDGQLFTYDAFTGSKDAIRNLESRIVPRAMTSLSCSLSTISADPITLRPLPSTYFGITEDGRTLHDFRLEVSGNVTVGRMIENRNISNALLNVERISASVDKIAAEFFYDALREQDNLKRFLFFFIFIERQTHKSFKIFGKGLRSGDFSSISSAKSIEKVSYFRDLDQVPMLGDRFIWCANFVWHSVSDREISEFLRLKKVRDDLAHGISRGPTAVDVKSVEEIAKSLFKSPK